MANTEKNTEVVEVNESNIPEVTEVNENNTTEVTKVKGTRIRRSAETMHQERLTILEQKIKDAEEKLENLKKAKAEEEAWTPTVRKGRRKSNKTKANTIVDIAIKAGKTPAEIAKALGIDIPDDLK